MRNDELTVERVRNLFRFNDETGELIWIANPRFTSNRVGTVAGTIRKDGYVGMIIDGKSYLSHRVVWLHQYGCWPTEFLDHANGNRADNRLSNLRQASNSENLENQRHARADNKSSGLMGVQRVQAADGRPWKAKIIVNGKRVSLGRFATAESAHAAYLNAKRQLHRFCTI